MLSNAKVKDERNALSRLPRHARARERLMADSIVAARATHHASARELLRSSRESRRLDVTLWGYWLPRGAGYPLPV